MKGWLLDTNVISELRKPNCNINVRNWAERQPPQSFYLSAVTMAEIRFGIEKAKREETRDELIYWLESVLRPWFSERILPIDEDAILLWRQIVEKGRKQGYTYSQPDLFIAAIAIINDLCVVTRNARDFEKAGVAMINPFDDMLDG